MTQLNSHVEKIYARDTGQDLLYRPVEKIRTMVVEQFPELGKITALRFIEWALKHPGWTAALPTGKTPEHFIKWTSHILANWETESVRNLLTRYEIDPARRPDLSSIHFVQIDEFYPIDSAQTNSFYYYVNKFYLEGFGFDPAKALLINPCQIGLHSGETLDSVWGESGVDLSLRVRTARNRRESRQQRLLAEVDEFCVQYERKIRELGGVGFFLGGIGPDGHIGFNVRGSDHFSTTRLCDTNYETQAAAAGDLGGIEVSAKRQVITIGLGTITHNPESTALIIAAGEAKAGIVKSAVESPAHNQIPASALQQLPNSCFYITRGAAKRLTERSHRAFEQKPLDGQVCEQMTIDAGLASEKTLESLRQEDFFLTRSGPAFLERLQQPLEKTTSETAASLRRKLEASIQLPQGEVFLHTAPHHDDIMLGYLPYLVSFARDTSNEHVFNYLTSGFNAVTNSFMEERCGWATAWLRTGGSLPEEPGKLKGAGAEREVADFLDGLAAHDADKRQNAVASRLVRCLTVIFEDTTVESALQHLDHLAHYFHQAYPGKKDSPEIQKLKGMLREWEAEVLWGHLGFGLDQVIHSRLGFYKGDIFTEEPEMDRDVLPLLALMEKVKPTVITVALDPEGSGPDTHFKVLQAVSAALKLYREKTGVSNIKVWGYRNVWYRFTPAEADLIAPVSLGQMAELDRLFLDAFASQREASFPSYAHQGPFSELAQMIQVDQYEQMKTLLGKAYFRNHEDRMVRSARGLVYLKVMDIDTFLAASRELKRALE